MREISYSAEVMQINRGLPLLTDFLNGTSEAQIRLLLLQNLTFIQRLIFKYFSKPYALKLAGVKYVCHYENGKTFLDYTLINGKRFYWTETNPIRDYMLKTIQHKVGGRIKIIDQ